MNSDLVLFDETGSKGRTRTVGLDVPAPWLVHTLLRSECYRSHVVYNASVDVALASDEGYAVAGVVPSDGVPASERTFEDFFSGGETPTLDAAQVTFRSDVHDVDAVLPAVIDAAEWAADLRGETV